MYCGQSGYFLNNPRILTATNSNNNTVFENNIIQMFQEENEKNKKTANSVLYDAVHSFSEAFFAFKISCGFKAQASKYLH